jgi:hypothetical protein
MNFDFLPYQLNADISDFKENVEYISSDNGVDLYRTKDGFIKALLGFPVTMANLYFFEGSLITVYIHLGENPEHFKQVNKTLELSITRPGKPLKLDSGTGYIWKGERATLAIIQDIRKERLYLYNSLKRFDVL